MNQWKFIDNNDDDFDDDHHNGLISITIQTWQKSRSTKKKNYSLT